jgi:hypothetical protein
MPALPPIADVLLGCLKGPLSAISGPCDASQVGANIMIYSYFVEKLARQSFANVQNHNYDEVLKALALNVTHHFAGDHALGGGTRHDKETLRRWFNRLGTVLPNINSMSETFGLKGCRGGRQSLSSGWRLQRSPMAIPMLTLASTSSQWGVRSVRSTCLRTLRPWPRA